MRFFILIAGLALLVTAASTAQAAPTSKGSYCAAVSGCEIISINMPGSAYGASSAATYATGSVEYCRGNKYKFSAFGALIYANSGNPPRFYFTDSTGTSVNYYFLDSTTLCASTTALP